VRSHSKPKSPRKPPCDTTRSESVVLPVGRGGEDGGGASCGRGRRADLEPVGIGKGEVDWVTRRWVGRGGRALRAAGMRGRGKVVHPAQTTTAAVTFCVIDRIDEGGRAEQFHLLCQARARLDIPPR